MDQIVGQALATFRKIAGKRKREPSRSTAVAAE
jgi:hypothetical protein